jgi:hypothetical protein
MIIQPVAAVGSWAMSPACASAASALPVASLLVACWRAAVWLNGAPPLASAAIARRCETARGELVQKSSTRVGAPMSCVQSPSAV